MRALHDVKYNQATDDDATVSQDDNEFDWV